jgi:HEAT repeat protein
MPAGDSVNRQLIKRVLDPDELLIKSDLIELSSLNEDELNFFEKHWQKGELKRKRRIVSDLLDLSFKHPAIDFSRIFSYWVGDPDAIIRANAVKGLTEEDDPSLASKFVHILLEDSSSDVKRSAADALGRLALLGECGKISKESTNIVYQGLLKSLDSKTEPLKVKAAALKAIAPLNMPRIKGLIESSYHSEDQETQISAIYAMGLNCNRTWLIALIEELKNGDPAFRLAAARALGELAEEDAILRLVELVNDEEPAVQEAAIKSIGEIGGDEAREFLNMLANDPRQNIRRSAKSALREIDICEGPLSMNF